MKTFWILALTLSLLTLLTVGCHHKTQQAYAPPPTQGVESQEPTGTHSEVWKLYTFASEGFEISSPQLPKLASYNDYRQYLVYWNEPTNDVINISFSVNSTDCAAWKNRATSLQGNLISTTTIDGNLGLESRGNRNSLQAGYMVEQCVDGRTFRFQAGWNKGNPKPPIVDQILKSFHILHRKS